MPTVSWNKFNDYSEQKNRGVHNWGAHTFRWALTNTAPTAANTVLADITQIAAGGGYTTGGVTVTAAISEASGTTTVTLTEAVWTGSGGGMGTFRYAVLYNDTATSPADALVGWIDYGSALVVAAGETFTIRANSASPGTLFTDV
jgi:hypothetical protein